MCHLMHSCTPDVFRAAPPAALHHVLAPLTFRLHPGLVRSAVTSNPFQVRGTG